MSFNMKINAKEVMDWVEDQSNREVAKRQMMTVLKNEIVKQTKTEATEISATGKLKSSIFGKAGADKLEIYSLMYGDIALEYGRRPGGYPPREAIAEWARIKLGSDDYALVSAIQRKIAMTGTQKYRRGHPKQLTDVEKRMNEYIIPNRIPKLLDEFTR